MTEAPVTGLGPIIKAARLDRKLSLRAFAKEVGVTAPFIADIENGRRFPSPANLALIATALGLDLETLQKLDERTGGAL